MMLLAIAAIAQVTVAAPTFVERRCEQPGLNGARCGFVEVPEDRSLRGGRTIRLNVVIAPATGPRRLPPLYDVEGGPGNASTGSAAFYLGDGKAYRAARDVVLIDQRGTGKSNPLTCPGLSRIEAGQQPMYPRAEVVRCREELSRRANLRKYGTGEAVADLDAVRAALGQQRIDLMGISYGTTFALRYLATYPERVRAAILIGPVPASARPPRSHAVAAQQALDRLFAQCRSDPACRSAFDPAKDLASALRRLAGIRGAPPREVFMEKLRRLMYMPAGARQVPFILHRAAKGDLEPYFAATKSGGGSGFGEGMYLSITCGESLALTDMAAARRASRATVFGDYRLARQQAACRDWPGVRPSPDFLVPVRAKTAVLIVAGSEDPVARPEWASELARQLPRSRLLMAPGGGHGLAGMPGLDTCFDRFAIPFLESGDPASVDASCLTRLSPPPFRLADAPRP